MLDGAPDNPQVTPQPEERLPAPFTKGDRSLTDLTDRLDALVRSYSKPTENHTSVVKRSGSSVPTPADSTGASRVEARCGPSLAGRPTALDPSPAETEPDDIHHGLSDELRSARIMIVDDEEVNILTVERHLRVEGYQDFITTMRPQEAMQLLHQCRPDVVLLDIRMPGLTGLDILQAKRLDSSLDHIPVIILTASSDPGTKRKALELGANDFLTKPLDPNDLVPRVKNALLVKKHYDQKADQAAQLEELVRRRTADLEQSRHELVLSLARAGEHRDNETGNHVLRVGRYAGLIARALGWPKSQIDVIELAAQLHDVGKIGVPDHILFKPGKLDAQEFEIIINHCAWGKHIIEPLPDKEMQTLRSHARRGENILHVRGSAILMMASRIAQTHHENWDGSGYPLGLAGEDIPIEGRITAIADVYDALSTKRPYKEAFPRVKCFEIMDELRSKKFDPRLLDCFFASTEDVVAIQLDLMDPCPLGNALPERA